MVRETKTVVEISNNFASARSTELGDIVTQALSTAEADH